MSLTRRDVLKTGILAGAALALPIGRVVNARWDDGRIAASKLPKPFTIPFGVPPTAVPIRQDATTDYYRMTMRAVRHANQLPSRQWRSTSWPTRSTPRTTRCRPCSTRTTR